MNPLHLDILSALKKAGRPLTDVALWAITGGYEIGGHGVSCIAACLDLEASGLIERGNSAPTSVPFYVVHSWQLTAKGQGACA